jgi:hypothetical protein
MKENTKVLTPEDFGMQRPEELEQAIQANVDSEKKNKAIGEKRNKSRRHYDEIKQRGFGTYPNRKYRRMFRDKNQFQRTTEDIELKMTPFQKWDNVTSQNIESGKRLHEAYINLISQEQTADQQARDVRVRKSLEEFYGKKKGAEVFRENKRLESIREDKKIMY